MRLTEFASPSSIAAVLSSGPLPMERTRNVLLGVLYSHERLTRLLERSPCIYYSDALLLYTVRRAGSVTLPTAKSRARHRVSG